MINMNNIENFDLQYKWILWFHKVNDNNWSVDSYIKIYEINTYYDVLFVIKELDNITSGMFFLMKEGILPVYEDPKNISGGYWSMRINKKDAIIHWEKIVYHLCLNNIFIDGKYNDKITGLSISPKINNCIFKIWNSDFKNMKTEYLRKDLDFINFDDLFYMEHSEK